PHDRRLVYADLRSDRLRVQKTRLSSGSPRPRPRPGRSGRECPAPEPHHVPGLAPHPVRAAGLRGPYRRRALLLRPAHHHTVVAPAPGRVRAGRIAPGDLSGSSRVKVLLTNPQFWIRCAEIGFLYLLLSGGDEGG